MRSFALVFFPLALALIPSVFAAKGSVAAEGTLQRRYTDGAASHYLMTGSNDGWQYTIRAEDVVRRDANGRFYEEIRWSDLDSNARQTLTPESLALRQTVSLDDPASYMKMPDLSHVQPLLIGPITDTLTIYSDLLFAMQPKLVQLGKTAYVSRTTPNSWADGQRVVLGEDLVDFALKVVAISPTEHTETLLIQHVPPPALHIQLPVKWMQAPASDAPNNFVQVTKQGDDFVADIGKETFDVRIIVDTLDGRILSAALHNPVVLQTRKCSDRELTQCGPATSKTTLREITWKLLP